MVVGLSAILSHGILLGPNDSAVNKMTALSNWGARPWGTPLGIAVHDHIIVGKNGHASLKGMRLI